MLKLKQLVVQILWSILQNKKLRAQKAERGAKTNGNRQKFM